MCFKFARLIDLLKHAKNVMMIELKLIEHFFILNHIFSVA